MRIIYKQHRQNEQVQPILLVAIFVCIAFVKLLSSSSSSSSPILLGCNAWTISTPVTQLIQQYSSDIAELKSIVQNYKSPTGISINMNELPYNSDVYYVRYCVASAMDSSSDTNDGLDDMKTKLQRSLDWRTSEQGQMICTAARTAVQKATTTSSSSSSGSQWNNNQENVFALAPYSNKVGKYITPMNCITTSFSTSSNDLIYCIRAGAINDVELFKSVTIDEMIQFFLYIKEVHAIISDLRSVQYNQLLYTITCNDLSNVKLIGGSTDFRKALSSASTIASTTIYPSTYSGPPLLCNLPILVSALVQLFTPLFPEKVKQRLKFVQGPLSNIQNLQDITISTTKPSERTKFLQQVQDALQ